MSYKPVFQDFFRGPDVDHTKWMDGLFDRDARGDSMEWSQWATNVSGINEKGEVNGRNPIGGRHAAYYNHAPEDIEKARRVGPEGLIMEGYVKNERDLTKFDSHHPYLDKRSGRTVDFRNQKLFAPWLQTAGVTKLDGEAAVLPESPGLYWQYGKFTMVVDFSKMKTPAYRFSWWWMAMFDFARDQVLNGTNYNNNAADGLEVDGFELVHLDNGDQFLLMTAIGGEGVAKHQKPVDVRRELKMDYREGPMTIELEWTPDGLRWSVNGREVRADTRAVPHCGMQMLMTREANSGVRHNDEWRPKADKPYLNYDPGLFGHNVGAYLDRVDGCQAVVRSVVVEQDDSISGTARSRVSLDDIAAMGPTINVRVPKEIPAPAVVVAPKAEPVDYSDEVYTFTDRQLGRAVATLLGVDK